MRGLIFSILYMTYASAGVESINPNRTLRHLFELYDGYTKYTSGNVKVRGIAFNRNRNEFTEKGNSQIIPEAEFDYLHQLGLSTFEATPGDNSSSFGTAFHVGGNFLLTNQHVLSTRRTNWGKRNIFYLTSIYAFRRYRASI